MRYRLDILRHRLAILGLRMKTSWLNVRIRIRDAQNRRMRRELGLSATRAEWRGGQYVRVW